MTVVMTVADLLAAFRPVAEQMLRPGELRRARFRVTPHGDWELDHEDTAAVDDSMVIAWRIEGKHGGTGTLWVHDDLVELLTRAADDLQDFVATSDFAWGERRPVPPIAPYSPEWRPDDGRERPAQR